MTNAGSARGPVSLARRGDVALIVIDRPPVNALNHDVRAGLLEAFTKAGEDKALLSVVLTCAKRTFVAGADIAEFDLPAQFPNLPDVIAVMEGMSKPVTAALFGTVLGGGLELALGCHYRIAAPDTRLGLPEITLGIMPGAGGAQRLPRIVGLATAMSMVLTGKPISAGEAQRQGLVDEIVEGDLLDAAIVFSRRVAAIRPIPLARDREDRLESARRDPAEFDRLLASHRSLSHDPEAVQAAAAALRSVIDTPIDEALRRERQAFLDLRGSAKAKARRHVFFAERDSAKIDLPQGVKTPDIASAAVIGAGTMGAGIAMCFANAGIPVSVIENNTDALARGLARIRENYQGSVSRGNISSETAERRIALVQGFTEISSAANVDIVVEAAFEDMSVKSEIFGSLGGIAREGTILATNTSYLDVDKIAQSAGRSGDVVGMHFFSPANVMRLVEIVRASETTPTVLAATTRLAKKLGKIPVVVGNSHGFVGNRMMRIRSIEAERLLIEGALPQAVDSAMTEFGFPIGPLAASDLAGLDISWRMRKAQGATAPIADQLCALGRFGQKTGAGFYRYQDGSRRPDADLEVEELIVATSNKLGISRRPFGADEIVRRLLYPMINEGARLLETGIARCPADIDVIWVYGYGFPAWRGGPMYHADQVGLKTIHDYLEKRAPATHDPQNAPAALISRLAASGGTFGEIKAGP